MRLPLIHPGSVNLVTATQHLQVCFNLKIVAF